MLLVQRHYVTKERIREILYPRPSDEAFEKMFERDKEELRSLGVPIEVGSMDAFFDDEPGYRIRPDEFELPDISLTADEAAVIGLATRVWQHAGLAAATTDAVRKLTAPGVDVDVTALDIVEPRLAADEPSFDVFWEATQERTPVVVRLPPLRRDRAPRTRHLQPWGVVRYSGRWYVVGLDTDREAERMFRLSRVAGRGAQDGPAGLLRRPARHRPARDRPAAAPRRRDRARSAAGRARAPATRCAAAPTGRRGRRRPGRRGRDWDRLERSAAGAGRRRRAARLRRRRVVEAPAELRDEVVDRLRRPSRPEAAA